MYHKLIISACFVLLAASGFSQKKTFDGDVENYPETVAAMFPNNVSEADEALIAQFAGEWQGGAFNGGEKAAIVKISSAFFDKKARNIHYWMLWRCLLAFKEAGNSGKGFEAWIAALDADCKERRTTPTSLQTRMTATLKLLNEHVIHSAAASEWVCVGDDFGYEYVGSQLVVLVGTSDIYCRAKGDSIVIAQTGGLFSVGNQKWTGNGGTVTWERAGYAPADVSARLGRYTIDMRQSQYEADSVMLTHAAYFPQPVMGRLIDRVRNNSNPETALYPEFMTHNKKFLFENLYPDVTYEGGISIQGARVIGAGTDDEKATIRIQKGDSLRMDVLSRSFVFRKDRVNSRNVSLNIHIDNDSIFHNNLAFAYIVNTRELNFTRADAASSKAPYNNSYHAVEMDFEQLIWKTTEPLMSLSTTIGSAGGRAQFRSQNFFDQNYFESLQYFDAVHPLVSIRRCAQAWGEETFPAKAYADFIRKSLSDARVQLIEIARQGFVIFDSDRDEATVLPRLHEFLAAAAKNADFDVIDLRSQVQAPSKNAMLNVQNRDLIINGIERFMVSDSQRVIITPTRQQVMMKKDRDMDFSGRIDAGQTELYGDSLYFDYDEFKINLHHVDSLYMFVPTGEKDAMGRPRQQRLKTAIEKLSGSILVDLPDNKSGMQSQKQFPILNSDSASYVYYGSSDIAGGAYDSESFYFKLDPFQLDSLDKLAKPSLALEGQFVSADIFRNMRQTLRVQPDWSLGFIHETDSVINAYGDAELLAEVRLSNQGLSASGKLDYLTATIQTDDFKLYPDSMNVAAAKEFVIRKQTRGTEFPDVKSDGNRIHWNTKKEEMHIFRKDRNFNMYDTGTELDGSLLLTPGGLSGNGRMDIGASDIRSHHVDFKANSLISDTSLVRLRATKDGPVRFAAQDSLRSEVDFISRTGKFIPTRGQDYALVQFPSNKFAAHANGMVWDMDSARLHIGLFDTVTHRLKDAALFKYQYPGESRGTRYYSTARDADSLSFVAPTANFDLATGTLKAEGVNLIKTSDAIIYTADGRLTLSPEGTLEQISNARIVFNDSLRQHTVYGADISIRGRRQYSGSGRYDYIDENGKVFVVDIPKIETDRTGNTTATGTIPAESEMMLNPYFRYRGNLLLASVEPHPVFDGAVQIVEECETIHPEWLKFKAPIAPDSIRIPVDDAPVNINNNKIYSGLYLTNDSTHIYPAFFSVRKSYSDNPLIQASGVLTYNRDSMIYFIAPERKLANRDTVGNLIAFDRDRCFLNGEGQLALGVNLGRVKTDVTGRITHNLNNGETAMNAMMAIDFFFDDGLAKMAADKINSLTTLTGIDMRQQAYIRGINQWLGVRKAETYRREAALGRVSSFPAELNKTLVFTQLNLVWNRSNRSWRSTGKIGIGNLFGYAVNRMVDGMVEITKRPGGDFIDIYLKMDDSNWMYFGYTRELMQVISSDPVFNDRLQKLPEKQRKLSEERPGFTYMIASADKLNQFLNQYNRRNETDQQPLSPSTVPVSTAPSETQPVEIAPTTPDAGDPPIVEIE